MNPSLPQPWLHRFCVLTALATLALIGIGGLVTSKGAGMAVPDWPTSYGYNMFLLPIDQWIGGIFYEHTHRLFAAFVGLLTSILAAWIWGRETSGRTRWGGWAVIIVLVAMLGHRGSGSAAGGPAGVPFHFKLLAVVMPVLVTFGIIQCVRHRGALRWLGMTAFFVVVFQGILGGLRVALFRAELGIFHGALAQGFFVLLCALALITSRRWPLWKARSRPDVSAPTVWLVTATALIFVQLMLGASMRHQHAGLAVPDFPLAHGQLWPATDTDSVARYNRERIGVVEYNPITAGQIHLHMTHRIVAVGILVWVGFCAWKARDRRMPAPIRRGMAGWLALVLAQAAFGVATVLSDKAADMATLHVVLGAMTLGWGAMLSLISAALWQRAGASEQAAAASAENTVARAARPAIQGA
jgi:heme a synthase